MADKPVRDDKATAVAELTENFRGSTATVLTEYRGLTVAQLKNLRRSLGRETTYAVAKNTLAKRAATDAGISGLDDVTGGGIPRGRPTLVCGPAGCGKTLLAIEFLARGITEFDEQPSRVREGPPAADHQGRRFRGQGHQRGRGPSPGRPGVP